jgi:hypothetical protein
MGVANRHGRTLRASLCEIERGVFYATYPESGSDANELIIYQVCPSAADAKKRIEASAQALGYETVIWDQAIVAPLFASHVKSSLREPAVT